jgi:hypothetical protein
MGESFEADVVDGVIGGLGDIGISNLATKKRGHCRKIIKYMLAGKSV